jgi:hypothetical protein
MKTIATALLALSALAAVAGPASAACTVKGWTNGQNQAPIWQCDDDVKK